MHLIQAKFDYFSTKGGADPKKRGSDPFWGVKVDSGGNKSLNVDRFVVI